MADLKDLIERELVSFLEWPSDDKGSVTTTSAKLFAEHVARLYADHIPDAGKMVSDQLRGGTKKVGRPQIREIFLRNGSRIEPDHDDLPDYVYESVFELLEMAATAVQGEPVATVEVMPDGSQVWIALKTQWLPVGMHKLYAAPQPAEQQPDDSAAVRLDKQCREDVAAALGFIRGGNYAWSYLLQQIKDITSAEVRQPAPDVAGLVEALEKYESAFEELFAQCCSNPITNAWGKPVSVAALNDAHAFASSRLAAHRKGGFT